MLAGRVIAILDADGNVVVSYMYDAWGAPLWCTGELAETLGRAQPFRYRGYVFDEETGLYYLRSRYYNPGWGRFVNADSYIGKMTMLSHNLFLDGMSATTTYTLNVMLEDPECIGLIHIQFDKYGMYVPWYPDSLSRYYGRISRVSTEDWTWE